MKDIEELLTYEIHCYNGIYYLSLPVQNLIKPKFLLKNKDLYILLKNYTHGFIIKDLPLNILENIINKNCYIKENLSWDINKSHLISLI